MLVVIKRDSTFPAVIVANSFIVHESVEWVRMEEEEMDNVIFAIPRRGRERERK